MQENAIPVVADAKMPTYKFNDSTIIKVEDGSTENISDDIKQSVDFYRNYMPKLDMSTNKLIPANMYINEVYLDAKEKEQKGHVNAYSVVHAYQESEEKDADGNPIKELLWAQPIVIDQNRYPNAVVNAWDGEFKIDDKNGTIMSSMVGAGYKNSDNTYSGVLMGNISGGEEVAAAGNKTDVGLYGFHHGE
jgi:hypothetical protein